MWLERVLRYSAGVIPQEGSGDAGPTGNGNTLLYIEDIGYLDRYKIASIIRNNNQVEKHD